MGLGIEHLKISNDTTIQQSILENQEAAGPTNIIGTINKIIDVAGTGQGGGDYQGSDSVYINPVDNRLHVATHRIQSPVSYPTYFQAINIDLFPLDPSSLQEKKVIPGTWPTNICILRIDYVWKDWYQVSGSVELFNLEHGFHGTFYKYFWNEEPGYDNPGFLTFYSPDDQFNPGEGQSEWAYGVLTWSGKNPINFYEFLYLYTSDVQNFKMSYKVSNGPQEIDYSKLLVKPMFKSGMSNKYSNEIMKYTGEYKASDWAILKDDSEIIWDKPGIYPLYIWPMFSPNRTIINIEIKE